MKTSILSLFLVGSALTPFPLQMALADDTATSGQTAPATGSTNDPAGGQGQRFEKFKAVLAQLNLTDAQKDQIKQIFATTTDRRERRQQIAAVLSQEQKDKLKELVQEYRNRAQTGTGAPASPS